MVWDMIVSKGGGGVTVSQKRPQLALLTWLKGNILLSYICYCVEKESSKAQILTFVTSSISYFPMNYNIIDIIK